MPRHPLFFPCLFLVPAVPGQVWVRLPRDAGRKVVGGIQLLRDAGRASRRMPFEFRRS